MSKEPATTRPTRPTKLYISIALTILLFVSLILLICWLSLRPNEPKFHIHNFTVHGLDQTDSNQIRFVYNVSVRNSNRHVGISYHTLTTALYHNGQPIGITPSFNSFDQEPKTTLYISHVLTGGAVLTAGNDGKGEFQLEMRTSMRYERTMWDLRRHKVHAMCEVPVGGDGVLLSSYVGKECPT